MQGGGLMYNIKISKKCLTSEIKNIYLTAEVDLKTANKLQT